MKLKAIVVMNDRPSYVFNKGKEIIYDIYGDNLIIGTNGIIVDCLCKSIEHGNKAFAGRELELKMRDGSIKKIKDIWWHSKPKKVETILGENIIPIAYGYIDDLRKCYVFRGQWAFENKIKKLGKKYKGMVYGYWEYESILKKRAKPIN